MKKFRMLVLVGLLSLIGTVALGQDQNGTPNYQKIADALRTIADEVAKMGVPTPVTPPPVNPPPVTNPPTPTGKQVPILNDLRIAALKKIQAANNADWQRLKAIADNPAPQYDDNGRAAAIVYRVTGDASYVAKSYGMLMRTLTSPDVINANNVREYLLEFNLIYYWIRDGLTQDQKTSCETELFKWSDFALGKNQTNVNLGGFRTGDSDQTIGQYMGLAVMDGLGIGPGNFLDQQAGGPIPTAVGGLTPTGDDNTTARNAIKQFCVKLGSGGTWFESCEYNSNTVVLLLMGWMALQDIYGKDYFPEIGDWAVSACDAVLTSYTPDFKSRIEWGDNERMGQLDWFEQIPYISCMQAAAVRQGKMQQAGHAGAMLDKMLSIATSVAVRGRYYYFVDHTVPSVAYYDGKGPLWNYSPGVGLYSRFDGSSLFTAFCPSRLGVDHENGYVSDVTLYSGGEWVLSHPSTYGGIANNAVGVNAVLVSGMSAMWNKGPLDCQSTSDYTYYVGNTNGKFYWPTKAGDPPSWCPELTRTILYLPKLNTIFTCDRINSVDPSTTVPDMWVYYQPDKDIFNAELKKGPGHRHQVNWHMPVIPTIKPTEDDGVKMDWKTIGGQNMQIATYSPQGELQTDIIDEHSLLPAASAFEAGQQVRVHPTVDQQYDVVISCVRLNPSANDPHPVTLQDGVQGYIVDGVTVLFGTDKNTRLIDPSVSITNAYLVGCSGSNPVVVK